MSFAECVLVYQKLLLDYPGFILTKSKCNAISMSE